MKRNCVFSSGQLRNLSLVHSLVLIPVYCCVCFLINLIRRDSVWLFSVHILLKFVSSSEATSWSLNRFLREREGGARRSALSNELAHAGPHYMGFLGNRRYIGMHCLKLVCCTPEGIKYHSGGLSVELAF